MKKSNTSLRLKEYMKLYDCRQVDILQKCAPLCKQYSINIDKSLLSQYLSGKVEPKQDRLFILAEALNVNEAWLMGYDIPMEKDYWRGPFRKWLKEIISKIEDKYGENVNQLADRKILKNMADNKIYYTFEYAQAIAIHFGTSIEEIVKQYGAEVAHKALEYHPLEILADLNIADNMLIKSVHEICRLDYVKDITTKDIKKIELVKDFIKDNEKTLKKMMEILDK